MILHLGVIDLPYAQAPKTFRRRSKATSGTQTTGDVAKFLENDYGVMEYFAKMHMDDVIEPALIDSIEGAMENLFAGGPFLLSVPGFPDELWVAFYNTGGSNINVWHITAARTGSPPTVTSVGTPPSNPFCHSLTLGLGPSPGSYPALYGVFNNSNGLGGQTIQEVFQGTYNTVAKTVSWALFAHPNDTNHDLPPVSQLAGFQSIRGSWNAYQRLLVPTGQSGFAYYNP